MLGESGRAIGRRMKSEFALNAFVRIGTDESVTVISAHSEMGQGIYTSLSDVAERGAGSAWSRIRVEAAPVDAGYNHPVFGIQMTGGSTTSPAEWVRYREDGRRRARHVVQAAANQWHVTPAAAMSRRAL